jgi:RNA polymerase sigma factor (sigma-70 family)
MVHGRDLARSDLRDIAQRCARQTDLYYRRQPHDPRYCYELWRRAIALGDPAAWERLYAQYHPLVSGWVRRHPSYASSGDDVHHLANCAFEKMWFALDREKFARFANIQSLLRYLQMCVHSAILDAVRRADDPADLTRATVHNASHTPPAVEKMVLDRLTRQDFWQAILDRLKDDRERLVIHASYALGLKPREIASEFPDTVSDVREVYRIKENVLSRLRRDPELGEFLHTNA